MKAEQETVQIKLEGAKFLKEKKTVVCCVMGGGGRGGEGGSVLKDSLV